MDTRRVVAFALSLLLCVSFFAFGSAICEIEPLEIAFGQVTEGVFVRAELMIFNPGSDALGIYEISADCGCSHCGCKTIGEGQIPASIDPGESSSFRITVNTTYATGEFEETLVVRTSLGDYSVPIHGLVSPPTLWQKPVARLNSELMLLIDIRSEDAYDVGHLAGAMSIPAELLPDHLEQLPNDIFLLFYDEDASLVHRVLDQLHSAGFCHAWGLDSGFRGWTELYGTQLVERSVTPLESLLAPHNQSEPCNISQGRQMVSPATLRGWATVLIDIRKTSEYVTEHLVGAISMPAGSSAAIPSWVPDEAVLLVYSNTGERDAEIVRVLNNLGYKTLSLLGGLTEWKAQLGQRFLVKP